MDNNFLHDFFSNINVFSASASITAVTICTMLTAVISQRGAKKVKQTELLFNEMVAAYHDYLVASSSFSSLCDTAQITDFSNAYERAMLFASKETKELIRADYRLLVRMLKAKKEYPEDLNDLTLEASVIRDKLLESMQKDLRK